MSGSIIKDRECQKFEKYFKSQIEKRISEMAFEILETVAQNDLEVSKTVRFIKKEGVRSAKITINLKAESGDKGGED